MDKPIADELAAAQIARLRENCAAHGITLYALAARNRALSTSSCPQLGADPAGHDRGVR